MAVISRRVVAIAAAIIAPLTALIAIYAPNGAILFAILWSCSALALAGFFARRWSRRLKEMSAFADRMLDLKAPTPRLQLSDDELGDLARSLIHAAPKAASLGSALDLELARRRAVLAGISEAVLAVDAKLNVIF